MKLEGALETKKIKMCVASEKFTALLTDMGEVWTFGVSDFGVLGILDTDYYTLPEPRMINDIDPMTYLAAGPQ